MKESVSLVEAIELVVGLPLSIVSGVLTLSYAPLRENIRWLIAGIFLGFFPMALILVFVVRQIKR